MENQETQQPLIFESILVIEDFLTKKEFRRLNYVAETEDWVTLSGNADAGLGVEWISDADPTDDDIASYNSYIKWKHLLNECHQALDGSDFYILKEVQWKIQSAISAHLIKTTTSDQFYTLNCAMQKTNTDIPYYADTSFPVRSGQQYYMGSPNDRMLIKDNVPESLREFDYFFGDPTKNTETYPTAWQVRPGFENYKFSAILFLNDNFEGGDLVFPNQDVVISAKKNKLVIFPSSNEYVHGEVFTFNARVKVSYLGWFGCVGCE